MSPKLNQQPSSLERLEAWLEVRRHLRRNGRHPVLMAERAEGQKKIARMVLLDREDRDLLLFNLRIHPCGYAMIQARINGKPLGMRSHRLIAKRMLGRPLSPDEIVDHLNGNKMDNRRNNLRITDRWGNYENRHRAVSTTGFIGVSKKGRKFRARLRGRGRVLLHESIHDTAEEAATAFNIAAEKHGHLSRNKL